MSLHLRQTENSILTLSAVVMSLLPVVTAAGGGAVLGGGELLEARSQDAVQLLMLPSVRHHLVGVGAVIVTFQTVEMARTFLIGTCVVEDIQLALLPAAGHAPETLELVPAERVQPLVPSRVLHEPGLVAKPIVAVLPHAVEVGLVLPVVAVGEVTIFVESESTVAFRNRLIFQHSHGGLESDFLLLLGQANIIWVQIHRG